MLIHAVSCLKFAGNPKVGFYSTTLTRSPDDQITIHGAMNCPFHHTETSSGNMTVAIFV